MQTSDGELIRRCLDGDPTAFGFLVEKYKATVFASAYHRLRNFHDAEDVTQDVFFKAYRNLGQLKWYDRFPAWLYAITQNECKRHFRNQPDLPSVSIEETEQEALDSPSMRAYEEGQQYVFLHDALDELKEMYREVLILHYLGGMKATEIAQYLRKPPDTIYKRLQYGRELLKAEILSTIDTTFVENKLQPSFTFRLVERIKQTPIKTAPHKTALPYSISATAGLILLLLALSVPFSPLYPIGQSIGSALTSLIPIKEGGIIPVDTIEVTQILILSSTEGDQNFRAQRPSVNPNRSTAILPLRVNTVSRAINGRNTVRIFDGTFDEADWRVEIIAGSGEVIANQGFTGGNTEVYRRTKHIWQGTGPGFPRSNIVTLHLHERLIYDPSKQGAVTSIDFSFDLRLIEAVTTGGAPYSLVLVQADAVYYSLDEAFITETNWRRFSFTDRTASDFRRYGGRTPPLHPDFSRSGGPIQFGYMTSNATATSILTHTISGIDNWRVSIIQEDEIGTVLRGRQSALTATWARMKGQ